MNIKTKLQIMATLPGIVLFITGSFFIVSSLHNSSDREKALVTDKLIKNASELVLLSCEHRPSNEERHRTQWLERHKIMTEVLEQASGFFANENEKAILDDIAQTQKKTKRIFEAVGAGEDTTRHEDDAVNELQHEFQNAYQAQMHSMMLIELQSIISRADMLRHINHLEFMRRSRIQNQISIFFLIVLAVGMPVLSIVIINGINRSIKCLIDGMDAVSLGYLDYRVGLTSKDEIGFLSRAFDRMTDKLQTLTVSRDSLLREIDERKKIEEELRKFTAIIEATTDFVGIADAEGHVTYVNPAGRKMIGISEDENISDTCIPDYHTEQSKTFILTQIVPTSIERGAVSYESEFLSRSGQIIPFSGVNLSHKAADGTVKCFSLIARDISERKRMEDSLLAEKKLSDEIIDSMPGIFYIFDIRGKFLRWNKNMTRVTGYSSEEIPELHPLDFFIDKDKSIVEQKILEVFEYGQASVEAELIAKDGTITPYLFTGRLTTLGTLNCLVGLGLDITERRRAEKELRRLTMTIEATTDFVGVADIHEHVIYMNPAGRKMIEIGENEDILTAVISDHITERSKKYIRTQAIPLSIEHGSFSFESEFLSRSGKIIPFSGVALSHKNSKGDVEFLSLIARDITERRRAEKEVKRFTDIIELTSDFVGIADARGKVLYANPAGRKMLELEPDEDITNTAISDYFTEETCKYILSVVVPLSIENGAFEYEAEFLSRSGRLVPFSGVSLSQKAPDGSIEFLSLIARDITERKKNEKEMIWLMTELRRSNKELEELAYVASHDLQEPLRKIASFTELFARRYRGKIDEKADVYIDYIVDGAMRMSALINDLLFYSRIMVDDKQFEVVDCNVVIKRILTDIQYVVNENKAEITFDNLPEVPGNDIQMGQLFQNLIANAIKYQRDGERANVHVSAVRKGSEWIFSFKDNGIGIEPEYVERIFVLFQRLHSRSEYSGTGIGLAVCKKIVERHGGRIWVESEYGKGSTFYFSMPA